MPYLRTGSGRGVGLMERREHDGAAEGSGRHVFFPVHKIGFCLSRTRGCEHVDDGTELYFTFLLFLFLFLFFGIGLHFEFWISFVGSD